MKMSYSGKDKAELIEITFLEKILKDAYTLVKTAIKLKDEDIMRDWFGKFNFPEGKTGESNAVSLGCNAILNFINANEIQVVSRNSNSGAFADQGKTKGLQINLGLWFSREFFCYGERVGMILHEISHVTPGLLTKDVDVNGSKAYKGRCIDLANDKSGHKNALKNAENWMYYLLGYYRLAGLYEERSDKWKYIDKKIVTQIESRDGKKKFTTQKGVLVTGQKWTGINPVVKWNQWPGYIKIGEKEFLGWEGDIDNLKTKPRLPNIPGKTKRPHVKKERNTNKKN